HLAVDAVHEAEDVGGAEHVGDDEDHQEQHDHTENTGTGRCFVELGIEVGELVGGQTDDSLFDLLGSYHHGGQLVLHGLVVKHGLELVAVDAELLLGNHLVGRCHRRLACLGVQAHHAGEHEQRSHEDGQVTPYCGCMLHDGTPESN